MAIKKGGSKANSWEVTYAGYIDKDGKFKKGFYTGKQEEIATYFGPNKAHAHRDFRDFFRALGVMEGGTKGYAAQGGEGK
jgi:hypothetical protein